MNRSNQSSHAISLQCRLLLRLAVGTAVLALTPQAQAQPKPVPLPIPRPDPTGGTLAPWIKPPLPIPRPDPVVDQLRKNQLLQNKYDQIGVAVLGKIQRKEGDVWYGESGAVVLTASGRAAYTVRGAIYEKWQKLGGIKWGRPDNDGTGTPDGVGRFNHFNGGTASIYWTPKTGAQAIWGDIRKKWESMGWERSYLGYPTTDETTTPDGVGRFNHFQGGSIYWTPQTGAHAIAGAIRDKWAALGWERSYLGYPTTDETDFSEGGKASAFQNGGIYWWSDTGAIDLRGIVVEYTGLHCFSETDVDQQSDSDEPYAILSASSYQGSNTVRTKIYDDVDDKENRRDSIRLYQGKPYGLTLGGVLMEYDFGDPNKFRDEVDGAVKAATTAAIGGIGTLTTPAVAALISPVLVKLIPTFTGAINDLLDTGDDYLGEFKQVFTPRQLILAARAPLSTEFDGTPYTYMTPFLNRDGASYKLYFTIRPQ